jgi:hypothetical protein
MTGCRQFSRSISFTVPPLKEAAQPAISR